MAENFEPATKGFIYSGRLEKQKQQNEYSNKDKKHPVLHRGRIVQLPTQRTVRGGYWVLGMVNYRCCAA